MNNCCYGDTDLLCVNNVSRSLKMPANCTCVHTTDSTFFGTAFADWEMMCSLGFHRPPGEHAVYHLHVEWKVVSDPGT